MVFFRLHEPFEVPFYEISRGNFTHNFKAISSISKDNLKQPQVASYRREGEGGGTACVRLFPDSLGKKERLDR